MNYHKITKYDIANGTGIRTVLWVSGCSHYCKDCHNPQTWDVNSGIPFDRKAIEEIRNNLSKTYISGITFSGGDPLHPKNRQVITALSRAIREEFPNKTQWLYTGYEFEEIKDLEIMKFLDVVVDGEFISDKKDISLAWRGSSNQKIYEKVNGVWQLSDMN